MEPANLLKIETLGTAWRDKDSVMLHACFQILKDCIEKEKLLDCHIDWDADEKHRQAKNEIGELYRWWKSYEEASTPNETHHKIETEMLIRLMQVRWALWT